MRGNDHRTPTHQTTSPLGRDDRKARTRTEGDSKAPSASIASSTCRKAGAQGKHTRNVVNDTGERKRRREEPRKGTRQPSRRTDLPATLHPLPATASAEAGQPLKLEEEQPDGKSHSSTFSSLIGDPSLTSTLDPLSLRRKVASLSLFYRYYFGHCSDELATCIPPPMARPRSTRQATFAHNYCVELSNARINRFSDGFLPSTSHLWNSLPSSVFLASFNLPSFKRQVYHHLRGQMA